MPGKVLKLWRVGGSIDYIEKSDAKGPFAAIFGVRTGLSPFVKALNF